MSCMSKCTCIHVCHVCMSCMSCMYVMYVMPRLTEDLRIREDINAFILGQHAGLTLGPGAVNLMGGRAGAARVAQAIGYLN